MGSSAENLQIPEGYVAVHNAYVEDCSVQINGKWYHMDGRYPYILLPKQFADEIEQYCRPQ